ncbi:MAG: hypothetical protein KME16_00435 [Scytolyngbya sp. HA4215-MV1]|jgi:hypothetical protein|nr:hypothetical protein [Scytolyngbya sp. HA4215-MV1]
MELYDLLQAIEKRPAMYLGQPSITQLSSFLAGYFFARRQLGISETEQEQRFSEFQAWIEKKFNLNSSQSWDEAIRGFAQDEPSALSQFFALFNEFSHTNGLSSVPAIKPPLAS